jgi:hypothetical protein
MVYCLHQENPKKYRSLKNYKKLSTKNPISGRLIGSPRQRSRVQDPISTINIHEGGHLFQNPTRCGVLMH